MLVPTTLTVTEAESKVARVAAVAGMPVALRDVAGAGALLTWPTMTAPGWRMTFLPVGAVGDNDASPPQQIATAADMMRTKPRSGVLYIESSGTKPGPQHLCPY